MKYLFKNAKLMQETLLGDNFKSAGVKVNYTGDSPYLWVQFPGMKSWDVFDRILDECHVVTTPGSGFGPAGESYIRFSCFGHRKDIQEACKRLSKFVVKK